MRYENICEAVYLDRPNRFIANAVLNRQKIVCHVKNTGRCKELLVPGSRIFLQHSDTPGRKTAYDLISVYKGERLINMDANAPNAVFGEWLCGGGLGFVPEYVKAEQVHGDSRFDFYFEHSGIRSFAEVKGVTLEDEGVVRFPDAPTERGVKHLRGLMRCVKEGFEAYVVFVIQMNGVKYFEPNRNTHPEFADVLNEAAHAGVYILALDCCVSETALDICSPVEIRL